MSNCKGENTEINQGAEWCTDCGQRPEMHDFDPYIWYQQPPQKPQPVKCDMCGSTAIDHTENQCDMNQQLKSVAKG